MSVPDQTHLTKCGGWLPSNPDICDSFIDILFKWAIRLLQDENSPPHHPDVAEFERTIKNDAEMMALFKKIFLQADEKNKVSDSDESYTTLMLIGDAL